MWWWLILCSATATGSTTFHGCWTSYRAGGVKLDELNTRRYALEEVNQGYQDMVDGKNIRGVIVDER